MGDILVRAVDDRVVALLKQRAVLNGTSLQTEASRALARGAPLSGEERGRLLQEFARTEGGFPKSDLSGAEILRQVRDEEM